MRTVSDTAGHDTAGPPGYRDTARSTPWRRRCASGPRQPPSADLDSRPSAGRTPRPAPRSRPTPTPAQPRTVERHLDEILGAVPQPEPIELAVLDAQGLLCAEDVVSDRALPPFDQAALDGYAARADDVAGASRPSPVQLAVVGESLAGSDARRRPSGPGWRRRSPRAR